MKDEKFELTDEQVVDAAGGFANMPNPFANTEHVTVNPKVFDGTGHANGETWTTEQGVMYKVKAGDSMYQISLAHGMPLKDLEQLNTHITNFKWIHPGDVIMLKRL